MKQEVLSRVVSILLKGREAVDNGWCKGFGQDGEVCGLEALWAGDEIVEGVGQAVQFLMQALPGGWVSVIHLNDDPATTKADILALYTRAIELALEAGP